MIPDACAAGRRWNWPCIRSQTWRLGRSGDLISFLRRPWSFETSLRAAPRVSQATSFRGELTRLCHAERSEASGQRKERASVLGRRPDPSLSLRACPEHCRRDDNTRTEPAPQNVVAHRISRPMIPGEQRPPVNRVESDGEARHVLSETVASSIVKVWVHGELGQGSSVLQTTVLSLHPDAHLWPR